MVFLFLIKFFTVCQVILSGNCFKLFRYCQIKKISVFLVTGRVGTHILFNYFFFSGKNIILCVLKGISPFKMH